jgi:preprotein translocase subunit YajC
MMIYNFFINDAFAQAEGAPIKGADDFSFTSFIPLVLIFVIFYFFIIRPQSKKYKDHQAMVSNLKIGNKVVTTGGIIGKIKDIKDDTIELEIAKDTLITLVKSSVLELSEKEKTNIKTGKKKS